MMSNEFNPKKYKTFNSVTGRDEPQFKELEDLPVAYRSQFKKVPGGGYVRIEAEENFEKARFMAMSEDVVWTDGLKQLKKIRRKIERYEEDAQRQSDKVSESFDAGRKRAEHDDPK